MRDLGTMLWKESAEFFGNRRFVRIFLIAVLVMGLLPALTHARINEGGHQVHLAGAAGLLVEMLYAIFAGVILVAQTAPDLVLRERSGRTLEYLLATRLSDGAILGGKVILAAAVGYASSLITVCVQILAINVLGAHHGWSWAYLALPQGRLLALLLAPVLAVYLATLGTFVALRVGEQRTAYLVTMLGVGLLALPFLLGIFHLHLAMAWMWKAVGVVALLAAVVVFGGIRLFRREMLVLSLQE